MLTWINVKFPPSLTCSSAHSEYIGMFRLADTFQIAVVIS